MASSTDWSGWGATVADGAPRVAAMASATKRRSIAGVWQPAITCGWSASMRSTVRWNLASSTSASHGLTYWAKVWMPSTQTVAVEVGDVADRARASGEAKESEPQ